MNARVTKGAQVHRGLNPSGSTYTSSIKNGLDNSIIPTVSNNVTGKRTRRLDIIKIPSLNISWVSFVSSSQFPVIHFPKTTCLYLWEDRPVLPRVSRFPRSWIIFIYIDEIAGTRNLPGTSFYLIKNNINKRKKWKSCFDSRSNPQ